MLSESNYNKLAPFKHRAELYVNHGIDIGGNTKEMADRYIEITGSSICLSCSSEIGHALTVIYDLIKEYENYENGST